LLGGLAAKEAVLKKSSDGEIHFILYELKSDSLISANDLNQTKIKKIMKLEAQKPLHLKREYE